MADAAPTTGPLDEDAALALIAEMGSEMADLRTTLGQFDDYYAGEFPLPKTPANLTSKFTELLAMSSSNWCRLVIDVVAERLVVGGIKSAKTEDGLDVDAWAFWQGNNLDAKAAMVHTEALKFGLSYVSVWPNADTAKPPRILGESPLQVHVRDHDVTGEPVLALKMWAGRDRFLYATLYDAQGVYRFKSDKALEKTAYTAGRSLAYDPATVAFIPRAADDDGGWYLPNPLGKPPFVRFATQPDLIGGYTSEIATILPIQDRINRTTFHRLLAQEFHAFPQRWVTGIDVPTDPDTGEPIEPFNTAVDRLWVAEGETTQFGQFPSSSPEGYLSAITADIQAIATQSRTPPHYLLGGMGVFPSGESVKATEYGLYRKVQNRQLTYGEAWEDVIRLAALVAGNTTLAEDAALSVVWADVEARSEGEIVDALLKMATLGVPRTVLWERWGVDPQTAERWDKELTEKEEALAAAQAAIAPGDGLAQGKAGPPAARVPDPSKTTAPDEGTAAPPT